MTVINVITVIFFMVIGIQFAVCAASADKEHTEFKKVEVRKAIGQKRNENALLRALSNYGVAQRPLNPAQQFEKHIDKPRAPKVETKRSIVIEKLKLSVILRDNVLYVFSYLLHGRENGLTEEQYVSLQMLYDVLRKRMVHVYNMLPVLSKMENGDKNQQTRILLLSLIENLPPYLRCAARFLIDEIRLKRLDLNVLLRATGAETFNYLANVDPGMIARSKVRFLGEEMRGYDKYSRVTQKALGPVFVRLLHNLRAKNAPLSQELFGLMLMNLPNPGEDPVLEENIRYLYDVTRSGHIMNWDPIGRDPIGRDAYTIVFSALSEILVNPNAGIVVKNAAIYIYNHLRPVTPTHVNPNFKYVHDLIKRDVDMGMLLAAVVPQEFGVDAIRMKDRLLTYFARNYGSRDLNRALKGFNRFGYRDPLDLLMALLTRISNRVPTSKADILQPSVSLLSTLIMKKHARIFTPFVSPEIDILMLLESLRDPELNPMLSPTIDSVKLELMAQPQISVLLSTMIPTEKNECLTPGQCLVNAFRQIEKLQSNVPATLTTKIQNMIYMLKSIAQYQPHNFAAQYSFVPGDTGMYDAGQQSPIAVVIEGADGTHGLDAPIGIEGRPYVWNIDKYISETSPVTQDGYSSRTSGWQPRTSAVIDSVEAEGEVSPTTVMDQARITEYTPSRVYEHVAAQSFAVNPSLTTVSYVPSQISYSVSPYDADKALDNASTSILSSYDTKQRSSQPKTSRHAPQKQPPKKKPGKPQTAQPHRITYATTSRASEEYGLEIEYPRVSETLSPYRSDESEIYQNLVPTRKSSKNIQPDQTKTPRHAAKSHKVSTKEPQKTSPKTIRRIQDNVSLISHRPSQIIPRTTTLKHLLKKQEKSLENAMYDISHTSSEDFQSLESHKVTDEDVMQSDDRLDGSHTKSKPSKPKPSKPKPSKPKPSKLAEETENVAAAIVFPPSIEPDRPLTIQISDSGVPVVTTSENRNATTTGLVLPDIKELLKPLDANTDFLKELDTPIVTQVLQPLSAIFGKNYIRKILKGASPKRYSTNIALLLAILKKAKNEPEVMNNQELVSVIRKYIAGIEYVSPTILLPIVISSKKLVSDVVYSTFNTRDPSRSEISENPPDEDSPDSVTVPLANPKIWLQSVNPSAPYADLLPSLQKGDAFEIRLRPLRKILTASKITEILGPDFEPLVYPNKGALLITLLRKLRKARAIQSNVALKSLIEMYIHAIEAPSMNIHVSEDKFVKMMSESTGHWEPELTSLIHALPSAKREVEISMIEAIEHLLADSDLLEKLHVARPSLTMTRGELLREIISIALSGEMHLAKETLRALRYYKDRVKLDDTGALPVVWVWVEVYVVKAEVKLGDMIEKILDFDQLAYEEKLAYNDLVTYLAENSELLQNNEDFDFEKYKTQGEFVKALFKYLLKKTQVSGKIKRHIQMLLPRIILTGPGAVPMPTFSEEKK